MKKGILALILIAIFLMAVAFYIQYAKTQKMELKSEAFGSNGRIPPEYTCDGENIIPKLMISGVPKDAKSLVLIMDDPDISESVKQQRGIQVFDHWVAFNISPRISTISKGEEPEGVLGSNGAGSLGYIGPCPPDKEHRYFFKLYALDAILNLHEGATKKEVESAMEGHIMEKAELIGRYERV